MDGPQERAVLAVLLERRRTAGAWAHFSVDVPGDAPGPNVDFGLEVIDGAGVVGADVPLSRHREGLFPGALGDRRRSEFNGGLVVLPRGELATGGRAGWSSAGELGGGGSLHRGSRSNR